jgi:hypothetical protein
MRNTLARVTLPARQIFWASLLIASPAAGLAAFFHLPSTHGETNVIGTVFCAVRRTRPMVLFADVASAERIMRFSASVALEEPTETI